MGFVYTPRWTVIAFSTAELIAASSEPFPSVSIHAELAQSVSEGESRLDYAKVEKPVSQKHSDIKGGFRTYQAYRDAANNHSGTSDILRLAKKSRASSNGSSSCQVVMMVSDSFFPTKIRSPIWSSTTASSTIS
jgi:hypothetical protein